MRSRSFYVEIFAVSLAVILIEIAYTRIFSFTLHYYFTYFIIGIALLGLGAGGVVIAISRRLGGGDSSHIVPIVCMVGGASVSLGYFGIAGVPLDPTQIGAHPLEAVKLIAASLVLLVPFLSAGIVIATILVGRPNQLNRLYGADLIGAALGCALAIPLLEWLDPPGCLALAGLIFALAGARHAISRRSLILAQVLVGAAAALPLVNPAWLPDPVTTKHMEVFRRDDLVRHSEWNPAFRVDLVECGKHFDCGASVMLLHDGSPGSVIKEFDGDFSKHDRLTTNPRSLPFAVVAADPSVLIIGSAGGHEILASLFFGAREVTGVELNPVTLRLLTEDWADYAGRLHENERVRLINGEGRWFLGQSEEKYDLVWFVAPDSYAAMNAASSAAFVLSESYLYTVEAIRESLDHLNGDGILCAQFGELEYDRKPNRTTRYLSTARAALAAEGVSNFGAHVLLATSKGLKGLSETTILLSRTPFAPERVRGFQEQIARVERGASRHVPGTISSDAPNQAITLPTPALSDWFDAYPYDVRPVTDDAPFFWHFARLADVVGGPIAPRGYVVDYEDAIGERTLVVLLGVIAITAGFFLMLPFVAIRQTWREMPFKARAGLYFGSLGLGFMFFEVCLIQMLTLFLGYPTYSLSVTLFGLLVFSGIGSVVSERYSAHRTRSLLLLLAVLSALVMTYPRAVPLLVEVAIGAPLAMRVAITLLLIAPLGLCLGSFMPLGLRTVSGLGPHGREYIAWAWAVNGFFSVMASILATLLAMTLGFSLVLLLALGIYGVGVLALLRLPEPARH